MSKITDLQITLGDIETELLQDGKEQEESCGGTGKRKGLRRGKRDGKGTRSRDGSGPEGMDEEE